LMSNYNKDGSQRLLTLPGYSWRRKRQGETEFTWVLITYVLSDFLFAHITHIVTPRPLLRFSISASLSRTLLPVSTDVESDSFGICVVSPHSHLLHLSVYFGVYFPKEKKLN
jgi:hypothetical protein